MDGRSRERESRSRATRYLLLHKLENTCRNKVNKFDILWWGARSEEKKEKKR